MSRIVSRIDRLKSYAKMEGPKGAGRDIENIEYWQRRASQNSDGDQHRARSGPIRLPDTDVTVRDTAAKPYNARHINARMVAKADKSDLVSTFMPGVRRTTV